MKLSPTLTLYLIFSLFPLKSLTASILSAKTLPSNTQEQSATNDIPSREDFNKIAQLIALEFTPKPAGLEKLFHPTFFQKFSTSQLSAIFTDHFRRYGRVKKVTIVRQNSPLTGTAAFLFDQDIVIHATITIAAQSPHQVQGLFLGLAVRKFQTFENFKKALTALPGTVNFSLARLDQGTTVLTELNAETPLAIASAFKLYVLASMLEKNLPWDQVIILKESVQSLPGGLLHQWPVNSPLTAHTLAALMISQSDNTAADAITELIGRETIEKLLPSLGNANAELNIPFLTTNEFFRLKSNEPLLKQYLQSSQTQKRNLLGQTTPLIKREQIIPQAEPTAINSIEWFASSNDLIRLLSYLNSKNNSVALDILNINQGIDISSDQFSYAGYKGGSEPGVMSLNWLLKTTKGKTYAMSMTWNNAQLLIDETLFLSLAQSALYLIEP